MYHQPSDDHWLSRQDTAPQSGLSPNKLGENRSSYDSSGHQLQITGSDQQQDDSSHSESQAESNVRRSPLSWLAIKGVLFYQRYLSPLKMGSTCRFEPTCSAYALTCLRNRSLFIATALTLARIAKCGPWHPGGFDPPPGWDNENISDNY